MAIALNNYDSMIEQDFDLSIAKLAKESHRRDVATETCRLCDAPVGKPCRSVFSGREQTWLHSQPGAHGNR